MFSSRCIYHLVNTHIDNPYDKNLSNCNLGTDTCCVSEELLTTLILRTKIEFMNVCIGYNVRTKLLDVIYFYACKYGYLNTIKYAYALNDDINFGWKSQSTTLGVGQQSQSTTLGVGQQSQSTTRVVGQQSQSTTLVVGSIGIYSPDLEIIRQHEFDITFLIRLVSNNKDFGFLICCRYGHYELAKCIYSFGLKYKIRTILNAFKLCIEYNFFDLSQWIYSSNPDIIKKCVDHLFETCCQKGSLVMAKFLHELGASVYDNEYKININIRDNDILDYDRVTNDNKYHVCPFAECCKYANIEVAKWIYSFGVDIHANNEMALRSSIYYNNDIKISEWLCSLGADINFVLRDESILHGLVSFGSLDKAKWIHSFGRINFCCDELILHLCIEFGHLDMAKWLHSIGADFNSNIDKYIRESCENGWLDGIKWFQSLGADIHKDNECLFVISCKQGQLNIAQWIYSLGVNVEDAYNNKYAKHRIFLLDGNMQTMEDKMIKMNEWLDSIGIDKKILIDHKN